MPSPAPGKRTLPQAKTPGQIMAQQAQTGRKLTSPIPAGRGLVSAQKRPQPGQKVPHIGNPISQALLRKRKHDFCTKFKKVWHSRQLVIFHSVIDSCGVRVLSNNFFVRNHGMQAQARNGSTGSLFTTRFMIQLQFECCVSLCFRC